MLNKTSNLGYLSQMVDFLHNPGLPAELLAGLGPLLAELRTELVPSVVVGPHQGELHRIAK